MNKSQKIYQNGQSLWFDNIDRTLIKNGWFAEKIDDQIIFGVTSNPSIFQKAITSGNAYSQDIQTMAWSGLDHPKILERLVIKDIQAVSDLLMPVYEETEKRDGYVNLEVDPFLASDIQKTIDDAKRLWKLVGRKNLMIKIPGTIEGISATKALIAAGININVTLLFSTARYSDVIDAYFSGLEERIEKGLPIDQVFSFASFFISRMDVMVEDFAADKRDEGQDMSAYDAYVYGNLGVQNALDAYAAFENAIISNRFKKILDAGGNIQRPLWASTGTKNSAFSDVLYVDELILPDTVNTVPPSTLNAWLDHGITEVVGKGDFEGNLKKSVEILADIGIDIDTVFAALEEEGVEKFKSAQASLNKTIEQERERYAAQISLQPDRIAEQLRNLNRDGFITRFYQPDLSLFTNEPGEENEVLQRMGWIDAPITSRALIDDAEQLLRELRNEGFTHAVVLGMGGSSLAPEVFSEVFKATQGEEVRGLHVSILDATDPDQIKEKSESIPLGKTLFIASSKSGTTVEMKSMVAFFMDLISKTGEGLPGKHFICITDPGTALEKYGTDNHFRRVINADPNVGGRYSALIAFGLVPAILAGIDGNRLLNNAQAMMNICGDETVIAENPAIVLATLLSGAYSKGIDKLTILADESVRTFGSWLEQLVAESSGKNGKGLIPVDQEPIPDSADYSNDRFFYYLRHDGQHDALASVLQEKGYSVAVSTVKDVYDIAGEMYKWEVAVAAFCCLIGVNPFNQPNVQDSKALAIKSLETYRSGAVKERSDAILETKDFAAYSPAGHTGELSADRSIIQTLFEVQSGDFIAVNAFLPRSAEVEEMFAAFRAKLLEKYKVPVTLGYGPRFLHSTGQLHKGGKNNGIFLMLTQEPKSDIAIPGEGIAFSTLKRAQATGDMQALLEHGRRVVHVHIKGQISVEILEKIS